MFIDEIFEWTSVSLVYLMAFLSIASALERRFNDLKKRKGCDLHGL